MRRLLMIVAVVCIIATGCTTDLPPDATGEEIYQALCTRCHGSNLAGGIGPALGPGSELVDRPDAYLIQTITVGLGRMPAFRSTLSEEQIVRVAEYLREQQASG